MDCLEKIKPNLKFKMLPAMIVAIFWMLLNEIATLLIKPVTILFTVDANVFVVLLIAMLYVTFLVCLFSYALQYEIYLRNLKLELLEIERLNLEISVLMDGDASPQKVKQMRVGNEDEVFCSPLVEHLEHVKYATLLVCEEEEVEVLNLKNARIHDDNLLEDYGLLSIINNYHRTTREVEEDALLIKYSLLEIMDRNKSKRKERVQLLEEMILPAALHKEEHGKDIGEEVKISTSYSQYFPDNMVRIGYPEHDVIASPEVSVIADRFRFNVPHKLKSKGALNRICRFLKR